MRAKKEGIGFALADVSRLMRGEFGKRLEGSGMTLAQARALILVARHEGLRQVDLARLLDVQPMSMARQIALLEKERLVERRADPEDGRAFRLYLREEAGARLAKIDKIAEAVSQKALAGIEKEEQAELRRHLERMRDSLSEDAERLE